MIGGINPMDKDVKMQNQTNHKMTIYDVVKLDYQNFLKRMEKSDLQNSNTRYIQEYALLQNLRNEAKEGNNIEDLEQIDKRIEEVKQRLFEISGYQITD